MLVDGLVGYFFAANGYDPGLWQAIALFVVLSTLLFRRLDRFVDAKLAA